TLNATIKTKDEQIIKSHDDQKGTINALIRSNEALIGSNKALIRSNDALTKAKSECEELISFNNNVISEKITEINIKDTLIISLKKQIEEQNEELQKHREDRAKDNNKLKSCLDNVIKNNHTLIEKDKEIQEKTDQAKIRDAQNSLLTSRINELSHNLTKANKRLLEFNEQVNACTTAEKGIHHIKLPGVSAFEAPCNGSGWTVIQRRMDGSVNFNRNWTEYRDGFGNLTGEFFLGLEKLHQITQSSQYELLISLGKVNGSRDFVKYDDFKIGSEENSYRLESIGNPTTRGAGDSLKYHLNMKFSTYDRDNDLSSGNCAQTVNGGWWFNECAKSHLNGRFYKDGKMKDKLYGIFWGSWHNNDWSVSLTFVEMMIRPKPS
ncbi:hypothetical protein KR074_010919, partial [Drosophila pseudoananassae]